MLQKVYKCWMLDALCWSCCMIDSLVAWHYSWGSGLDPLCCWISGRKYKISELVVLLVKLIIYEFETMSKYMW